MSSIFTPISDFFSELTGFIPDNIIQCLVAVCLLFLVYFLVVRWIFTLCKAASAVRIADIVFVAIVLIMIWEIVQPSFTIDKYINYQDLGA